MKIQMIKAYNKNKPPYLSKIVKNLLINLIHKIEAITQF